MNTLPGRGTAGFVRVSILSTASTLSTKSSLLLPHINLTGNRGGDQGSAVFLKPLDSLFDFGYQRINLGGFPIEGLGDDTLLRKRWPWDLHPSNNSWIKIQHSRSNGIEFE